MNDWPLWEVFVQEEQGGAHLHAGSVHAPDAELALQNARDVYARRGPALSIWVAPATAFTATKPSDSGPFFDPADDKLYRHPNFYETPRALRKYAEKLEY